jgi:hypothetical protein
MLLGGCWFPTPSNSLKFQSLFQPLGGEKSDKAKSSMGTLLGDSAIAIAIAIATVYRSFFFRVLFIGSLIFFSLLLLSGVNQRDLGNAISTAQFKGLLANDIKTAQKQRRDRFSSASLLSLSLWYVLL